jgi:pimeloyl-ACP methyl ester carboxylesterase
MSHNIQLLALSLAIAVGTGCTAIQGPPGAAVDPVAKPDIVLVHGAYADGSSWSKVITLLQGKGYHVTSVQNPTTSLADDVLATERVLNHQAGPVVLVGHSWAGVVITQAGNHPKVRALVYVDASAPDSGQSLLDAAAAYPAAPGASAGIKDEDNYLTLPAAAVDQYFGQDLTPSERGIVTAVQIPWAIGCLTDKVTHAAWHEKPSWWVIGEHDHMIAPELQRKMAAAFNAKVTTLPTSHLAMLADPKAVMNVIIDAADAVAAEKVKGTSAAHVVAPSAAVAGPASQGFPPAPVLPLASQPPARLIVDSPLPAPLEHGYVVIRYRAENLRILPVYGPGALAVMPRLGHLHITVDDGPWHWLDASGEPLSINGLTPGPHKVLFELEDPTHKLVDSATVHFEIPQRS